jgi:putative hydrolase of the HAD superfamily
MMQIRYSMSPARISTLFLNIGGVYLTNGGDRSARKRAAEKFNLGLAEMDERHHVTFDTYEEGKMSLYEYLSRVVFYEERSFLEDDFRSCMFDQAGPIPRCPS